MTGAAARRFVIHCHVFAARAKTNYFPTSSCKLTHGSDEGPHKHPVIVEMMHAVHEHGVIKPIHAVYPRSGYHLQIQSVRELQVTNTVQLENYRSEDWDLLSPANTDS